jgi:AraC-like DNA-binding protein
MGRAVSHTIRVVPTRVVAHESALGRWEIVSRPPGAALRPYVRHLHGFLEATPAPLRRREVPIGAVVMILSLEHGWSLRGASGAVVRRRSFLAGLQDGPTLVEHAGASHGMEVYFTPLGARAFLGVPLDALAGQVLELEEVLGPATATLTEQLADAAGWDARFEILERAILHRLTANRVPSLELRWAWGQLSATHGRVAIGALAAELGWSQRRLVAQFRDQIGMSPKRVARILRFDHAYALLRETAAPSLADVAYACGYADQPHFTREFRALAGITPRELLARRLPEAGGIAAA